MKAYYLLFTVILLFSCQEQQTDCHEIQAENDDHQFESSEKISDNTKMLEIYKNELNDRRKNHLSWEETTEKDSLRRLRVHELLDSKSLRTAKDYYRAAVFFIYGTNSKDSKLAVDLMKKSIALNPGINKWLLAAATDRYLLSIEKPQIYGTQYRRDDDGTLKLAEMDAAKITDEERQEYGVRTLAQQHARIKKWNSESLYELVERGKSVDEILKYIQNADRKTSPYDLSESGINQFGYNVMGNGETREALKIFKLNTELYPNAWNTFDSYGECLSNLGKKDEAIAAYKKSLELNPNNDIAKFAISEIRNSYKKRLPKKNTFDLL